MLAFGISDDNPLSTIIAKSYVLKDSNGTIELVLGDLSDAGSGYGMYELKLVHLQDMPKPYIFCGLSNGEGMFGFSLYELTVSRIHYGGSPAVFNIKHLKRWGFP
ncbi:hypothetical protein EHS13_27140 [Paenibacillus psychroresistens]|uniref:Uncharacterized protein n=1 Tax=Paenibacillus psychroresistens TaxID=1778678 RepID=A0A6B8RR19_9BACL|nr:hypothetical protein [Paenibacillus psychroresistens]QGQ98297.1 hypothetical protein EHS13_27140 [Paenibacillus psychroresistens]